MAPPTDPYCVSYYSNWTPPQSLQAIRLDQSVPYLALGTAILLLLILVQAFTALSPRKNDNDRKEARKIVLFVFVVFVIGLVIFAFYNKDLINSFFLPPVIMST